MRPRLAAQLREPVPSRREGRRQTQPRPPPGGGRGRCLVERQEAISLKGRFPLGSAWPGRAGHQGLEPRPPRGQRLAAQSGPVLSRSSHDTTGTPRAARPVAGAPLPVARGRHGRSFAKQHPRRPGAVGRPRPRRAARKAVGDSSRRATQTLVRGAAKLPDAVPLPVHLQAARARAGPRSTRVGNVHHREATQTGTGATGRLYAGATTLIPCADGSLARPRRQFVTCMPAACAARGRPRLCTPTAARRHQLSA